MSIKSIDILERRTNYSCINVTLSIVHSRYPYWTELNGWMKHVVSYDKDIPYIQTGRSFLRHQDRSMLLMQMTSCCYALSRHTSFFSSICYPPVCKKINRRAIENKLVHIMSDSQAALKILANQKTHTVWLRGVRSYETILFVSVIYI